MKVEKCKESFTFLATRGKAMEKYGDFSFISKSGYHEKEYTVIFSHFGQKK
jgi:hypothetical protein